MWVIYDTNSGVELDRIENYEEAKAAVRGLNGRADYDHYGKRWEE